jgi:hypothetical protein
LRFDQWARSVHSAQTFRYITRDEYELGRAEYLRAAWRVIIDPIPGGRGSLRKELWCRSAWLQQQGLEQYAQAFADNDVDMTALRLLEEADLENWAFARSPRG